jgi:hypothetical protein
MSRPVNPNHFTMSFREFLVSAKPNGKDKTLRLLVPLSAPIWHGAAPTPTSLAEYVISRKNWVRGVHGYVRRAVEEDVSLGMLRADAGPEEVLAAVIRRFSSGMDLYSLPRGYGALSLQGVVRSIAANWRQHSL